MRTGPLTKSVSVSRLPRKPRAFTLIEIMVVVAIMAVVMGIAIPSVYRRLNPESMQKAVTDILNACDEARSTAILKGEPTEMVIRPIERQVTAPNFSGGFSEKIAVEMLDVNFFEFKNEESATVRFYPNGTCDEFTIVLHSDKDEWRKITLEVVTALADVESDPNKWR